MVEPMYWLKQKHCLQVAVDSKWRVVVLVLSWYALSTSLSLYNKKLLGKSHGIIHNQPFPAPVMMSAMQFALQHYLARLVHYLGVKRSAASSALLGLSCMLKDCVDQCFAKRMVTLFDPILK